MTNEDIFYGENAKIKVIGVGGGGGNAVNRMIQDGFTDAEFIVVNTDQQVLDKTKAKTILIGEKATKGLGAGANPEVGRKAAEENREDIKQAIEGADLVYITAGMGGGTGTGAAPVVAQIAKELDILTIGVVTMPFSFEGNKRSKNAVDGKRSLSEFVDTLITIPNDKIIESLSQQESAGLSMEGAFQLADSVLSKATIGVTSLIKERGNVNLDFADIKTVVKVGGSALMGIGEAKGEEAALKAADSAMANPLLTHGMVGAKGVIMNFTTSKNYSFIEVHKAASAVKEKADENAEILFGHIQIEDEDWPEDLVRATIVGTGFVDEDTVYQYENNEKNNDSSFQDDLYIPETKHQDSAEENRSFTSYKKLEDEFEDDDLNIPTFLRGNRGGNRANG